VHVGLAGSPKPSPSRSLHTWAKAGGVIRDVTMKINKENVRKHKKDLFMASLLKIVNTIEREIDKIYQYYMIVSIRLILK
jgi:hypothetical protein